VPLLRARAAGDDRAETSLDLGLSRAVARVTPAGVTLPAGETVGWEALERIAAATTGTLGGRCFAVRADEIAEIQVFSPETQRRYSLLATDSAPTMLVSGVQMHRTKGLDPWGDTREKVSSIAPLVGRVLDTCTGLGYTAIAAAGTATEVVTVELDPAALDVARQNPWSAGLFDSPRIAQRLGDSFDVVPTLPDGAFARIVHDPPAFSLAGQLYGGEFYRQLYRVLARGGRLFHYLGNAGSGSGQRVTRGAVRRLQEAGFGRIVPRPQAFGVVAYK
jgi:predicted methyltransferase